MSGGRGRKGLSAAELARLRDVVSSSSDAELAVRVRELLSSMRNRRVVRQALRLRVFRGLLSEESRAFILTELAKYDDGGGVGL